MADDHDRFTSMAQEHFGEQLRVVRQYNDEGGHVLFMRDDIDGYDEVAEESLYELLRRDTREFVDDAWYFSAGEFRSSVRILTQAVFVNVPVGEESGFVVIVDRGTESSLERFTEDARSWLAASELWQFDA